MAEFEIIGNNDKKWDLILRRSEMYDFYHTAFFHKIDTVFPSYLLLFKTGENFIALPIVLRPIEQTNYFDITSVYGYSGPVYHFENEKSKMELIHFFSAEFRKFCSEKNVVSVFSRLHPLLSQQEILVDYGETVDLNKTISIDLTIPEAEQKAIYRKSLKSELNQLRRKDIVVESTEISSDVDRFIEIYYETMDRVNSAQQYYFSKEYFHQFLNNTSFDSKLLIAKFENEIIAGAIFTFTDEIMQYHLAGTAEEHIRLAPMKLILDEARLLGNKTSASDLHLGGGVGGSDEDSLFTFKSAFSKNFKQFSVWKYIHNTAVYNELAGKLELTSSQFFPLYRANAD